jgi:hypothetical protein
MASFQDYGAVGNGITDDTIALQNALDNEEVLTSGPNLTYKISSTLFFRGNINTNADFNNSTIQFASSGSWGDSEGIIVSKRTTDASTSPTPGPSKTYIKNLIVDVSQNLSIRKAFTVNSHVNIDGLEIKDMFPTVSLGVIALRINLYDDPNVYTEEWELKNIYIHDVRALNACSLTSGTGSATGLITYWYELPSQPLRVNIDGIEIHDIWGCDSSDYYYQINFGTDATKAIQLFDSGSMVTINNGNFYNSERRIIKGASGVVTFNNSIFTSPDGNNSNLDFVKYYTGTGQCYGEGEFCDSGTVTHQGIVTYNNCTFAKDGTYDGRVIGSTSIGGGHITFNNCLFKDSSDMAFFSGGAYMPDVTVCGTTFNSGSTVYDYGGIYTGNVLLSENNIYQSGFASVWGALESANIVIDPNLTCNTIVEGPSAVISNIMVNEIDVNSFRVSWNLDIPAQGRVEFSRNTGVYTEQSATEFNYLTFHSQVVGNSNPSSLRSGTTYYFRIWANTVDNKISYSEEITVIIPPSLNTQKPLSFGANKLNRGYIGPIKAIK